MHEWWHRHDETYEKLKTHTLRWGCFCCTNQTCKKIREPCQPFIYLVIILMMFALVAILFAESPSYHGRLLAIPEMLFVRKEPSIYEKSMLQLHPELGHHYVNHQHDMCTNPYGHVCSIDEPDYSQLFTYHNHRVLSDILNSDHVAQSVFGRLCFQFHSMDLVDRFHVFAAHPRIRDLVARIHSLTHRYDIPALIANHIHSVGVREPWHINLMPDQSYRFDVGRTFDVEDEDMSRVRPDVVNALYFVFGYNQTSGERAFLSYWTIRNALRPTTTSQYENVKVASNSVLHTKFHFDLAQWFLSQNISEIAVDMKELLHFQAELPRHSLPEWKQYLLVCVLRSLLHQVRLLVPVSHEICKAQYLHYFPLDVCRDFRSHVKDIHEIEKYQQTVIHGFRTHIIERNKFEFSPEILQRIQSALDTLEFYINKCALHLSNETVTHLEQRYLNHTGELNSQMTYLDLVFQMIAEPQFQERRNQAYDFYYRNLLQSVVEWNAWFDPALNAIFVPAGMLLMPSSMQRDSVQYYVSLRIPEFHEMNHFLSSVLSTFPEAQWSPKYKQFMDTISQRYQVFYDPVLLEENLADNNGLDLAYRTWNETKPRSDDERRAFFVFFVRLFCRKGMDGDGRSEVDMVTDHGSPRQRAALTLRILGDEVARLWNCTNIA